MLAEIVVVGGGVYALLDMFKTVPMAHYGVREIFGKRYGEVLDEGVVIAWPFFEHVHVYPYEHKTIEVEATVNSSDLLKMTLVVRIEYRPARILVKETFAQVSEASVTKGLQAFIKSEAGIISGTKKGEEFVSFREEIQLLLSSVLILHAPPHHVPYEYDEKYTEGKEVEPKKRIKFYREHKRSIRDKLKEERMSNVLSPLEILYGIEVLNVVLAESDFSEDTQKAFEKKTQAGAENKAVEARVAKAFSIIKEATEHGLTPAEAAHLANIHLSLSKQEVTSFEGLPKEVNFFLGRHKLPKFAKGGEQCIPPETRGR